MGGSFSLQFNVKKPKSNGRISNVYTATNGAS